MTCLIKQPILTIFKSSSKTYTRLATLSDSHLTYEVYDVHEVNYQG